MNGNCSETNRKTLSVALPKGRLGEKVCKMLAEAGYEIPETPENSRKLVLESPTSGLRFFWVKPSDVGVYVERGAADIGVAGKDILLEYRPDVYELADLGIGKCRIAVAAPEGFRDDPGRTLRVATKFSNIAADYYGRAGRSIDVIHLNGSIELAPLLGLSDVILDIVETGTTLRENHLEVIENVLPVSARLIAGKTAYRFKTEFIREVAERLAQVAQRG